MVSTTPRTPGQGLMSGSKKGGNGGGLRSVMNTITGAVNGGTNGHKLSASDAEKEPFVPATTGDVFAGRWVWLPSSFSSAAGAAPTARAQSRGSALQNETVVGILHGGAGAQRPLEPCLLFEVHLSKAGTTRKHKCLALALDAPSLTARMCSRCCVTRLGGSRRRVIITVLHVVTCSAPSPGAWGSVSDSQDVRRGIRAWWIWRRKWTILGTVGLLVFLFFRYGGVGAPPQDNDFIQVRGTEVRQAACPRACIRQPTSESMCLSLQSFALLLADLTYSDFILPLAV